MKQGMLLGHTQSVEQHRRCQSWTLAVHAGALMLGSKFLIGYCIYGELAKTSSAELDTLLSTLASLQVDRAITQTCAHELIA